MTRDDLRVTFFQECDELLDALSAGLRAIDAGAADGQTIHGVFRAVHSIKGAAGAFGLDPLVAFAHDFESALDDLRSGAATPAPALNRVLLQAGDHLADLVAASRDGTEPDLAASARLCQALRPAMREPADAVFTPRSLDADVLLPMPEGFIVTLRPQAAMYHAGNDPALLIRDLAALGPLAVSLDASALPDPAQLDWQESYLAWTLHLTTTAGIAALREVFEFVEGLCDVEIVPAPATTPPLSSGDPAAAAKTAVPVAPLAVPDRRQTARTPTIRVDPDRVDRLIDTVGELVIRQAMLTQAIEAAGPIPIGSAIGVALAALQQLSRDIQDGVMAIRAQPVKPLFDRMHRILREAAEAAGKPARLTTDGEATEVDKTLIEKLMDPLTHMIRNSVDHGIEPAARRQRAGKPAEGRIHLAARHRSGRVILTLSDDGGGIDRTRVRDIAIGHGLIDADAALTPAETDDLLFLPGFSTARTLSQLSGRGVGLDVVRSAIADLGGRVTIRSEPGIGTTFTVSLPLTLAVLDGMVVGVCGERLVIPSTAILEALCPDPGQIRVLAGSDRVICVRGAILPVVDVGHALGFRGAGALPEDSVVVLVETEGAAPAALAVDRIEDQRQVVIKSIEQNYGRVPGIAAATVLGDGRIALILDSAALAGAAA